ncbi:MAG: hypothetical protein JWN13_1209 [Betaproteobacteria bacterium]|jgi:hypothetical protein|nr:hypothetical protein [Betaproteobacteria bacterium]MEA3155004.1 hypothetical protein [Betaproteobacteria bacterium]
MSEAQSVTQKVQTWARGKLGRQIGRGECWDLGEQALKQAGALTSNDLGPVQDDTDYVWGELVSDSKDIEPGYILQLRDHVVTTTTTVTYTFADGSTVDSETEEIAKRGHHTAIANGKVDINGALKTLEQHVKPRGEVVQNKILYLRDVRPVVTKTVETLINPATKKREKANATKTVTITVSGSVWIYKPKAK